MMQLIRITDSDDAFLKRLISLYEESFPLEERRPVEQLKRLIKSADSMHFNAVVLDGELCGLFVFWDFETFYYLEHFAIYPHLRNKKIGQQVLDYVAKNLSGLRLLEVEPAIDDEIAIRRVEYYRRNGYKVLEKEYIQPSYHKREDACPVWIMGNENSDFLPQYIERIKDEVYRRNISE